MATILIAEDDLDLNRLIETVLAQNGHAVLSAANGREALNWMDQRHVDLIVSDIMMPDTDGFALLESLRAAGYTLPILFVTARDGIQDKSRGFQAGVDDYMVKPIDIKELVLRVDALLRRFRIMSEHLLSVGQTVLDSSQLTVARARRVRNPSAKGVSAAFQTAFQPRPHLYPHADYGRNLGNGFRKRRAHHQRPYQQAAQPLRAKSGFPYRNGAGPRL